MEATWAIKFTEESTKRRTSIEAHKAMSCNPATILIKTKKRKEIVDAEGFYGLFLNSSIAIAPTNTIVTIIPATAGTKYCSTKDGVGVAKGP